MARANSSPRGFTLMEATVALGLFTIGMLGLGGAFSQIVHADAVSRHKQMALLLAQRKLAELRIVRLGDLAQTSGTFGPSWEGYTWSAQCSSQSQDLGLLSVWVEVKHSSGTTVSLWSQMTVGDGS